MVDRKLNMVYGKEVTYLTDKILIPEEINIGSRVKSGSEIMFEYQFQKNAGKKNYELMDTNFYDKHKEPIFEDDVVMICGYEDPIYGFEPNDKVIALNDKTITIDLTTTGEKLDRQLHDKKSNKKGRGILVLKPGVRSEMWYADSNEEEYSIVNNVSRNVVGIDLNNTESALNQFTMRMYNDLDKLSSLMKSHGETSVSNAEMLRIQIEYFQYCYDFSQLVNIIVLALNAYKKMQRKHLFI